MFSQIFEDRSLLSLLLAFVLRSQLLPQLPPAASVVSLVHFLKDLGPVQGTLSFWDLRVLVSRQNCVGLSVWAFCLPSLHVLLVLRPVPLHPPSGLPGSGPTIVLAC